jgi:hypothetical protein
MGKEILETGVDVAYKLILMNGKMSVGQLADAMKVDPRHVEVWGKMLSRRKLIKVRYPMFGKPFLMKPDYDDEFRPYSERHPVDVQNQALDAFIERSETSKKVMIKDWVVDCPKANGQPVTFNRDCMSCPHFNTVAGSMLHRGDEKEGKEFKAKGVMCTYRKSDEE